ncbi:MAG: bifunctional 5,10-methylenetetrahydrofolate dehydrogenase/5,10-methenyltetrahydrofolate cyclohydrolase [Dehalococcoidia bacterium]
MTARIINGTAIAAKVRSEVAEGVRKFHDSRGHAPGLAVVLVGDDPASHAYVRGKERACQEAGIFTETRNLPADISQADLIKTVSDLNDDRRFHGILVQLPLPGHIDEDAVIQAVDPGKDVDGLHPVNIGLLFAGTPRFAPATPLGVQRMLIEAGVQVQGARVVICGRSNLVGKPLAGLLLQRGEGANATVTLCHTGTRDMSAETRRADILIAAMGRPGTITADMVRPGAVVIDVGTSRVDDPSRKRGYRLAGDVAFDEVSEVAAAITSVPGGVGPMTIAMLLHNVLLAAQLADGQ